MSLRRSLSIVLFAAVALSVPSSLSAQRPESSKEEIFGGYSWYRPGGTVSNANVPNLVDGLAGQFIVSMSPRMGLTVDLNYHRNDSANVFSGAVGPRFYFPVWRFTPFGEAMLGFQRFSPKAGPGQNAAAYVLGFGLDVRVSREFSIRPFQADYINSYYTALSPIGASNPFNGYRLQSGIIYHLGLPPEEGKVNADCKAEPSAVDSGSPVRVEVTTTGFLRKRILSYSYSTNGGKVIGNTASAAVDTTGVDAGKYVVSAKVADNGHGKHRQAAECQAAFSVSAKAAAAESPKVEESAVKAADTATAATATTATAATATAATTASVPSSENPPAKVEGNMAKAESAAATTSSPSSEKPAEVEASTAKASETATATASASSHPVEAENTAPKAVEAGATTANNTASENLPVKVEKNAVSSGTSTSNSNSQSPAKAVATATTAASSTSTSITSANTRNDSGVPGGTVTVHHTPGGGRNLTGAATTNADLAAVSQLAHKFGTIGFRHDARRPTRVDNEAKGELDRYADALAAAPDAKGIVVGYATSLEAKAAKKSKHPQSYAALRAVNTKDYMVKGKGIDPTRIEPRVARGHGKKVELWIARPGSKFPSKGTEIVNESKVKAVPRIALRARHHRRAVKLGAGKVAPKTNPRKANAKVGGRF